MRQAVRLAVGAVLLTLGGPAASGDSPSLHSGTRMLATKQGRLAYDDTGGPGRLVIAMPGLGDLRQQYRFLTPMLTRAGYRVATLDLRGFGDSDAVWPDFSAQAVGTDFLALEAHLGQHGAILVGNSYAAAAAVWAAHEAPGQASALVLLGPALRDHAPPPWYMRATMALMFASPWRVSVWLDYWDSLFPTRRPVDQALYRSALQRNLDQPGRMHALDIMLHLPKAATQAILPQVKTPTLIVMGSQDADFDDPAAEATELGRLTGADVRVIPGAGHYPHVEMPDVVGPVVVRFLQRRAPP